MWSYVFVGILFAAFTVWFVASWWRDGREVEAEARAVFEDIRQRKHHPLSGLNEREFIALYSRANRSGSPVYIVVFLAFAAAGSVLALALMSLVRQYLYLGPWVWGFQTFFALILSWVAAFAATLKLYHARKPGPREEAFRRSRF